MAEMCWTHHACDGTNSSCGVTPPHTHTLLPTHVVIAVAVAAAATTPAAAATAAVQVHAHGAEVAASSACTALELTFLVFSRMQQQPMVMTSAKVVPARERIAAQA
jgi:hypothetical protein